MTFPVTSRKNKEIPSLPSVSVVIPAYNAADSLARAVQSVLEQTCRPKEIVVVDDGSTDETAEVAKAFPQVHYIRQENAGVAAARNRGIREVSSEWLAFLDADDQWYPRRLEASFEVLMAKPELHWCGGVYHEIDLSRQIRVQGKNTRAEKLFREGLFFENFYQAAVTGVSFSTCAMTLRTETVREIGGFDESRKLGEDLKLWYEMADRHPQVGYVMEPMFQYLRRSNSLTKSQKDHSEKFFSHLLHDTVESYAEAAKIDCYRAQYFRKKTFACLKHAAKHRQKKIIQDLITQRKTWLPRPMRLGAYFFTFLC